LFVDVMIGSQEIAELPNFESELPLEYSAMPGTIPMNFKERLGQVDYFRADGWAWQKPRHLMHWNFV
jgi:hypothetical protein